MHKCDHYASTACAEWMPKRYCPSIDIKLFWISANIIKPCKRNRSESLIHFI